MAVTIYTSAEDYVGAGCRLRQIQQIADRVTVLADGSVLVSAGPRSVADRFTLGRRRGIHDLAVWSLGRSDRLK